MTAGRSWRSVVEREILEVKEREEKEERDEMPGCHLRRLHRILRSLQRIASHRKHGQYCRGPPAKDDQCPAAV
jgi:hypothetical protein